MELIGEITKWLSWACLLSGSLVLLMTGVTELRPAGQVVARLARYGLVLALFLVGLGLNLQTLRQVSGRALVFGVSLWLLLAAGTLLYVI